MSAHQHQQTASSQTTVPLQDYLDMVEIKEEMQAYYTKTLTSNVEIIRQLTTENQQLASDNYDLLYEVRILRQYLLNQHSSSVRCNAEDAMNTSSAPD